MRIALITDSHLALASGEVYANACAVRAWAESWRPDLTVHLGDVTAEGAAHSAQLAFAASFYADWPGPLHILPGNHDIGDNDDVAKPASQPAIDSGRLGLFRQAIGPDRFSLSHDGWTLIGLNAQLFGSGGEDEAAQAAWLDDTLSAAAGPVGLFLHKPLFRTVPDETERHQRYIPPAPRAWLIDRLRRRDLRFVACGHTHQFRQSLVEGVEHLWAPSCAFKIPDNMQETIGQKVVGVLTLELEPQAHSFSLKIPKGLRQADLLDQHDIYPQLAAGGHH
jgi:3',5'-cyclic AMP phosphodiesterase CpdA